MNTKLDLAKEAYSSNGSYFSVRVIPGSWAELGKGLYIQTHHNGQVQAFRLDPVRGKRKVAYEIQATPTSVKLQCSNGGTVTLCIDDPETVRIKGKGIGLRLEAPPKRWCYAYLMPGGVWGTYISDSKWSFALESLRGTMDMDAPWVKRKSFCKDSERIVATCTPDSKGVCELALDEFRTSWIQPKRPPFNTCIKNIDKRYTTWCAKLPAASKGMIAARDRAAYVNWSAVLGPCGYLKRQTMLMSKASMCNVFGWDHAFNAMAHARHDPQLAWDQLMVMSDQQDSHGKLPDNMNDQNIMYSFGKPPIHGWAARFMMKRNPRMFTPERLRELYDYLSSANTWFLKHRVWPGDTLPFYTHGFESGWDNSTVFDKAVPVVSPDLGAFLALQCEVVADIADKLDLGREAESWRNVSTKMIEALVSTLWRDDQFVAMIKPDNEIVKCQSLLTSMPIVLGQRLPSEIRKALVKRIQTFVTKWGLATEHVDSPCYTVNGYWRGPIWAPSTMLALSGLKAVGEKDLARDIAMKFLAMCKKSGFAENFDALSGQGHFCPSYTWTSSVFMMLAEEYSKAR